MGRRILFLLLLSPAAVAAPMCWELFATPFKEGDLTYPRSNFNDSQPSVEVRGPYRSRFLLNLKGASWWSTYTPRPNNYQGDPRWFAILMGPTAAAYFGFAKLSDRVMTAPTATFWNRQIRALNLKLAEPIVLHFFEGHAKPESDLQYLLHFLNSELPIARRGHYAVHDTAFHGASLLLPPSVIAGIQKRIQVLLKLGAMIQTDRQLSGAEKALMEKFYLTAILKMARLIDFGTGNVGFVLAMQKLGLKDPWGQPYSDRHMEDFVLRHLVTDTQRLIEDVPTGILESFFREINEGPPLKRSTSLRTEARLRRWGQRFTEIYANDINASHQDISTEQLAASMAQRLSTIQNLVR